jgi:DNA polymerase III epsilon subunit-like protein
MLALIFDVETTGLPKKRKADIFDFENWPHIVQISWLIFNVTNGKIISINDHIISLQEGKKIPEASTKVHGITDEIMREKGENIIDILNKFNNDLMESQIIVAHNIEFDETIIGVESLRWLDYNIFGNYNNMKYCTMRRSRKIKQKWMKLVDLHEHLFKTVPQNLHNSLIDVFVCFRCFCKLYYNSDPLLNDKFSNKTWEINKDFENIYNEILCN